MARKRQPLTQSTWVVTSPSPRKRLYLKLPIACPSVSFSSSPAASSSRVADTLQLPSVDLVTRRDSADCHLNRPPQPPVENRRIARRETQTVGESTVNASTSLCRPHNVLARKRRRIVALSYRKQDRFECCIFISNVPGIANQRARKGLHFIKYIVISCVVKPVHLLNLSTQNAPDCIPEHSNVQNFPGGMSPDTP